MSFTNENVDRLTSLPEDILSQILSLMPTKYAVRTSILSKRWRYTWTLIHNLDFEDSRGIGGVCLSKIVDLVLRSCKTTQFDTFRLKLSDCDFKERIVSRLIRVAIRLNVCELDIDVKVLRLPLSISSCKTLTKFRLHLYQSYSAIWDGSASFNLPFVKILDIVIHSRSSFKYQYWGDSPVVNLPKFPNLKYLKLNGDGSATWNLIHNFLESSSELEHLSIEKLNGRHWNEPEHVPTCMFMSLKTMEFDLIKARKCDINFLKFMLGNSKVLKKLTVTCRARKSLKGNERLCATLSGFPRASRDCELQFI